MIPQIFHALWKKSLATRLTLVALATASALVIIGYGIAGMSRNDHSSYKAEVTAPPKNMNNNPGSPAASPAYTRQLNEATKEREALARKTGSGVIPTLTADDRIPKTTPTNKTTPDSSESIPYSGPNLELVKAMLENWKSLSKGDSSNRLINQGQWTWMATPTNNGPASATYPQQKAPPTLEPIKGSYSKLLRGNILPTELTTDILSTMPGPVTGVVVEGPYIGSILLGTLTQNYDSISVFFDSITPPASNKSYSIRAQALEAKHLRSGLATEVDYHRLASIGGLLINVLFGTYSAGLNRTGQSVQITRDSTIVNDNGFDKTKAREFALAQTAAAAGNALQQAGSKPPTVRVEPQKLGLIGVLLLEDFDPAQQTPENPAPLSPAPIGFPGFNGASPRTAASYFPPSSYTPPSPPVTLGNGTFPNARIFP